MALLHAALHSPKAPPPLSFVVRHGAQESGFRVVGGISRTIGSLRPRVQTYRGGGATSRVRALRRGSIHWASPCEPTAAAPLAAGDKAEKWKATPGLQPTWLPTLPAEELHSLRHRSVLASSFAPQRHVMMVLGRPVVAASYALKPLFQSLRSV